MTVSGVTEENLNAVRSFFDSLGTILQSTALIHNYIKIQYVISPLCRVSSLDTPRLMKWNVPWATMARRLTIPILLVYSNARSLRTRRTVCPSRTLTSRETFPLSIPLSIVHDRDRRLDIVENNILRQFPQKRKSFCSTLFDFLLGY